MKYVIGIDSGGTNYRLKACTLDGIELGYYVGKPASIYALDKSELIRRINDNIDCLLKTFSGRREDAVFILCGTTGLDSKEDEDAIFDIYANLKGFSCPVRVLNDAELAHYTVTGGEGVLIISGTGTIAYAKDRNGNCARSGGWLFTILGDEGSGAWVSRMALRQLGRFYDGAIPRSPLIEEIEKTLDIHDRNGLNSLASRMGNRPWGTPALGMIVDESASRGDKIASRILEQAAMETFNVVADVVTALGLESLGQDFKLGLWGSNLLKSSMLKSKFLELVTKQYPEVRIVFPVKESIDGAVELAIKETMNMRTRSSYPAS